MQTYPMPELDNLRCKTVQKPTLLDVHKEILRSRFNEQDVLVEYTPDDNNTVVGVLVNGQQNPFNIQILQELGYKVKVRMGTMEILWFSSDLEFDDMIVDSNGTTIYMSATQFNTFFQLEI